MPYFKNAGVNVLFVHIPKTGGTSIERYFSRKFNIPLNSNSLYGKLNDTTKLKNNVAIRSSLQHITYKQMVKYNKVFNIDFDKIKIIAIVRNPYERIVSDLFFWHKITINSSKEEVFHKIIKYLASTSLDNHNMPQHNFLRDANKNIVANIQLLKTENLTTDMIGLGFTDFNRIDNNNPRKVNYYNYLNYKSIKIINQFYHLDFKLFNYNKIRQNN